MHLLRQPPRDPCSKIRAGPNPLWQPDPAAY